MVASAVGKLLLAENRDADALLGPAPAALTDRAVSSKSVVAEQDQLLRKQIPVLQDCATQLAPLLA